MSLENGESHPDEAAQEVAGSEREAGGPGHFASEPEDEKRDRDVGQNEQHLESVASNEVEAREGRNGQDQEADRYIYIWVIEILLSIDWRLVDASPVA